MGVRNFSWTICPQTLKKRKEEGEKGQYKGKNKENTAFITTTNK